MRIAFAAKTDIGKLRVNNEDTYACCPDLTSQDWMVPPGYSTLGEWGALSIVADGMGGAEAGEIASSIAVAAFQSFFSKDNITLVSDKESFIKQAFQYANESILDYVKKQPDAIGMGTTLVLLWVLNHVAYIAWVGDSRCYVFHPQKGLIRLTKDHSYVEELIDKGEIRRKDAQEHPDRNIITRGLGDLDAPAEPDIVTYSFEEGDVFLLCSDGLCGYVQDEDIESVMCTAVNDIPECCDELIRKALATGGEDNITVAIAATLPDGVSKRNLGLWLRIRKLL